MKKILLIAALVAATLFVTGCNDSSSTRPVQPAPAPTPTPPPAPAPVPDPEPSIPTAGVGSIKGDLDCNGGTITTNYTFGNVSEDDKAFVIEYKRNGKSEDLTYPSTSTTGSRAVVKDIYYVRANDEDAPAQWVVSILYQTPDATYNLVTTNISQPVCDDNVTAKVTTYEVK